MKSKIRIPGAFGKRFSTGRGYFSVFHCFWSSLSMVGSDLLKSDKRQVSGVLKLVPSSNLQWNDAAHLLCPIGYAC